jgi:hypothetical protein
MAACGIISYNNFGPTRAINCHDLRISQLLFLSAERPIKPEPDVGLFCAPTAQRETKSVRTTTIRAIEEKLGQAFYEKQLYSMIAIFINYNGTAFKPACFHLSLNLYRYSNIIGNHCQINSEISSDIFPIFRPLSRSGICNTRTRRPRSASAQSASKNLLLRILEYLISCVPDSSFSSWLTAQSSKLMAHIHIARIAHGVLTKNKFSAKFFICRPTSHLSQKTSCGRGTIFARGAHFRAIYGGMLFSLRFCAVFLNQQQGTSNQQPATRPAL